jgi:hypothetical protein
LQNWGDGPAADPVNVVPGRRRLEDVSIGRRSEAEALSCHDKLTELKMRLLGDRVSRRTAWRIARDQGWDILRYAEYLAIASLQADAFVTVDGGMAARAARLGRIASVEDLMFAG